MKYTSMLAACRAGTSHEPRPKAGKFSPPLGGGVIGRNGRGARGK